MMKFIIAKLINSLQMQNILVIFR